ncbi:MAG: hypothetical protein JXA42_24840 [Anaerolineales bacterium]|nr:hypothetical protein [Anaerolineales bacterium]
MGILRRILGVIVMIAGILGLILSLAGLAGVWIAKPTLAANANTTIDTLNESIDTSKSVMEITEQALGATIDSVDALSEMLGTTADTVEDTKPILDEIDVIMADTLPSTLQATTDSLYTAQGAAQVLESTIQSLDAFRFMLSAAPLVGDLIELPEESYNPEKPLAESLGELAANLEDLPDSFVKMSDNLSATDENLSGIQGNLNTMSDSVGFISSSLGEYQAMIIQSQSSMDDLKAILTNFENRLPTILDGFVIAMSLFFVWLLVAQIVILSQGWELFQGTAGHMEGNDDFKSSN